MSDTVKAIILPDDWPYSHSLEDTAMLFASRVGGEVVELRWTYSITPSSSRRRLVGEWEPVDAGE